jgi:hypothetical protein
MNELREPASSPAQSNSPDRHAGGEWFGLLFQGHPVTLALSRRVIPAVFVGYPVLIVLASLVGVSWIGAVSPAVDVLRQFLPIFDRLEQRLVVRGMDDQVAAMHHVFAIGYLLGIPIFLFMFVTVVRLSREEMKRVATSTSPGLLIVMLLLSVCIFGWGVWWAVWGAEPFWSRDEPAIIEAGITLAATIIFGSLAAITFRAIMVMDEAESR